MKEWLVVLVVTMIPWLELRGSIPLGILKYDLNPVLVFLTALTANVILIPALFVFLDYFFDILTKFPFFDRVVSRTHRRSKPYVEKYGTIGLALFVGVPLPFTGVYSGSLAAHILGVKDRRALAGIALGALIAGVLVTLFSTVLYDSMGFLLKTL